MYEFISEKEIEKIVLEHIVNAQKVEETSRELLKYAFEQISSRILLQVKLHIENNNRFKSVEKLYIETQNFKKRYEKYLEFDYNEDIHSENEKEILRGVFKTVNNALDEFPAQQDNPIEYERSLIVTSGLLKIKEGMNMRQEETVNSFELSSTLNISFGELLNQHMRDKYESYYDSLNNEVTAILTELNDSEKRKELQKYVSFLEGQELMLKNFIYINLEIGQEMESLSTSSELTGKYIYPLRQLFQDIHTSISDVKHVFRKKQEFKPLEIRNIDKIIEANILRDKRLKELIEIIEDDKNNTVDRIITHINDELTKTSTTELKKIKNNSTKFELLSFIIIELFEECLECVVGFNLDKIDNDIHTKIIQGVTDTLHLKYDSLKDKDSAYHLAKKESYLEYSEAFIQFKNNFEQECESYLEEAISGSTTSFSLAQGKFLKMIEKQNEDSLEFDLDYYKKDILFELRTLEDLMHQSVDKLKVSSEDQCIKFVECVEQMNRLIMSQLKRNNIVAIRPKEHDVFNGKLHEILVAEEVEGYNKGQIIRTQNSGYLYGNRVLVRASVIAAK